MFDESPETEEPQPLNDKEKFRKIMPVLTTIGSLRALHPTKRFYEYLTEFEKIENYVRKGDTIFEDYNTAETIDDFQELIDASEVANDEFGASVQMVPKNLVRWLSLGMRLAK